LSADLETLIAAEEAMAGAEPAPEPAAEAEPAPEPAAEAEPAPEPTPEQKELSELRKLRAEKDAAYAILRRRDQQLRAQEEEHRRRTQDIDARWKKVEEAEHFERTVRENPLTFFEQAAQKAGMKPSELLERVQRRYLNQGLPGPDEQLDEVKGVKSEIAALREELKREKEEIAKQRAVQQEQERRQQDVVRLEKAVPSDSDRWRFLSTWQKTDEGEFRRMLDGVMELVDQTGQNYSVGEVLDYLEERERVGHDRYRRLNGEQVTRPPGDEQKADRGTGSPATARKPAAANKRTVTNGDAANGSGARRDMTPEERLLEADRILRGQ
jgi:hypothetical protein